jgi:phosphatidate cytidylyltransferase
MNNIFPRIITTLLLIVFFVFLFFLPFISLFITLSILSFLILWNEWFPLCKKNYYLFFLTLLYPVAPLILLLNLVMTKEGSFLFFLTFLLVAIFDIASFIVGSFYGKYIIVKKISPKKTWEGFLGGIIAVFITGMLLGFVCNITNFLFYGIHLFLIGIFAFLGDLFESFIKRLASVKDSGTALPGHGGLLDRFDSLFGAIIYVYVFQNHLTSLIYT